MIDKSCHVPDSDIDPADTVPKAGSGSVISANTVPLLPGTENYAAAGHIAGGLGRNRDYFETLRGATLSSL